jgi:hypothetical protein
MGEVDDHNRIIPGGTLVVPGSDVCSAKISRWINRLRTILVAGGGGA